MKRNIVSFYDLPGVWQEEAKSNLGDLFAEECSYLEPLSDQNPKEHTLWDLSTCVRLKGTGIYINGDWFRYNAYISISNNSSMLLWIDEAGETATIKFT